LTAEYPADYLEARWYAAYVCANHEKRVLEQLERRSVEAFLPVYESLRRWKDRRVRLARPLFPGYVFVHMALRDRLEVMRISSVVCLVGCNGRATPLPDVEIETLKKGLAAGVRGKPHPYLTVGRRVKLKSGPLAGMQGILLRRKGNYRLVISIEQIRRSVLVDADTADVEPLR
jgi:transcription antitermination factor NusG